MSTLLEPKDIDIIDGIEDSPVVITMELDSLKDFSTLDNEDGILDNIIHDNFSFAQQQYKVSLEKDRLYTFILDSDTQSYPDLEMQDLDNNYIWEGISWNWDESWTTTKSEISFLATETKDYIINVNSFDSTDSFSLEMKTIEIEDDYSSDINTTAILTSDTSIDANLDFSGDKDWFKTELVANNTYTITLDSIDDTLLYAGINIKDSDGNDIWDGINWDWDENYLSVIDFTPTTDAIYFLEVDAWGLTGDYTLGIEKEDIVVDDYSSDINTLGSIITDTLIDASLDFSADKDWFKTELVANTTYTITLDSTDGTLLYAGINIKDSDGNDIWDGISWDWDENYLSVINFTPTNSDNYFLEIDGWGSTGNYSINMEAGEVVSDDFSADINTIGSITTDTLVDGSLDFSADKDWFKTELVANTKYTIRLDSTDDTLLYAGINIKDSNGYDIWDGINWDWDENSLSVIHFTPTTDAEYFLEVDGWGSTGSYQINMSKGETIEDDFSADILTDGIITTQDIENGSNILGSINFSEDKDWFRAELVADTLYTIKLDSIDDTLSYAGINIKDSDGYDIWEGIGWDWDENSLSVINFTPTTDSEYFFEIDAWGSMGNYELEVTKISDDYSSDINTTAILTNNTPIDASIEFNNDKDWFKSELVANTTYTIRLDSIDDTLLYAGINVKDSTGNDIWDGISWDWDENSLSIINFTPTTDAEYFFEVDAWGSTGNYNINMEAGETFTDDFGSTVDNSGSLTAPTDNTVATINGSLDFSEDKDWFKTTLVADTQYTMRLDSINDDINWAGINIKDSSGNYIWEGISWDWDADYLSVINFIPTNDDIYFLEVDGWGSTGDYSLEIEKGETITDDFGSSVDDSGVLITPTSGSSISKLGSLDFSSDIDWFETTLVANTTYTITLDSVNDDIDWAGINIKDSNGDYIWEGISWDWDANYLSIINFTPSDSDNYFIEIDGWGSTGDYMINMEAGEVVSDDFSADIKTTGSISTGSSQNGSLDFASDKDWFKVQLSGGKEYSINLTSINNDIDWAGLNIKDSSGEYIWEGIGWDWDADYLSVITFAPEKTGEYFIEVDGWGSTGDYTLEIDNGSVILVDTIGNTTDDYGNFTILSNGQDNVDGIIETTGDSDWYQFEMKAGISYEIDVSSTDIEWLNLDIKDSSGEYVWDGVSYDWNNTGDTKQALTFVANKTSNYFVDVQSWEKGNYNLSIKEWVNPDIIGDTIEDASSFIDLDTNSDASVEGILDSTNDSDIYKIIVTQNDIENNTTYNVILSSSNMSSPNLDITDSTNTPLLENLNWNWELTNDDKVKIDFTPTEAGEYYLNVNSGWEEGDYTLTINETIIEDDFSSDSSTIGEFNIETSTIEGELETSYDTDWFKISAIEGDVFNIKLSSTEISWANIDIMDTQGNYIWDGISWNWDITGDEKNSITFTASESKDYFISISGYEEGNYSLNVDKEIVIADDFVDTIENAELFTTLDTDSNNKIDGILGTSDDVDVVKFIIDESNIGGTFNITLDINSDNDGDDHGMELMILNSNSENDLSNISYDWDKTEDDKLIFTANNQGEYYIKVAGWVDGEYTLGFEEDTSIIKDDYGNTIETAGVFTDIDTDSDNIIDANLNTVEDNDWFKVSIDANTEYKISMNSNDMNNTYLNMVNTDGTTITNGVSVLSDDNYDSVITFVSETAGEYYIDAGSWGELGDYNLTLEKGETLAQDIIGSDINNYGVFTTIDNEDSTPNNNIIDGSLETNGDSDWYQISLEENKTYTLTLNSTNNDWTYLDILDMYGETIYDGIDFDNNYTYTEDKVEFSFTASQTKDYFASIQSLSKDEYSLEIVENTEVITDDYSNGLDTTGNLTLGETLSAKIDTIDDYDAFRVELQEGKTYKIQVLNNSTNVDIDTVLNGVFDAQGNYMDGSFIDDTLNGTDAQQLFYSEDNAIYYISAGAKNIGTYDILVEENIEIFENDIIDNKTTTSSIIVDTTFSGDDKSALVEFAYDKDWIKVNLEKDRDYNFDLKGVTIEDVMINGIYDKDGNLIENTTNDNGSQFTLDSHIEYKATESGEYYISVGSSDDSIGSYSLSVSNKKVGAITFVDESGKDINNTAITAISNNIMKQNIDGIIEYDGDTDWFAFEFEAGKDYEIKMSGVDTDSGTLSNSLIKSIRDSDGNIIENSSDDNSGIGFNSSIIYSATESGTYYVEASATGSSIGSYQINVAPKDYNINTEVQVATNSSWTIMMYIAGDNNLELAAMYDLLEMELGELPEDVTVTFMVDRAEGEDDSYGDWTDTRQGIIIQDTEDSQAWEINSTMETIGEKDTSDGQTLTDFIDWSVNKAEADNYSLVIWDHGGGVYGTSNDNSANHAGLGVQEMTDAVIASSVDKFEMIGFDTCLQGTIEQTYAVKDIANVVVSSQELEPGYGWDYTNWFNKISEADIDGEVTAKEMATAAVDSFAEFYAPRKDQTTLSAVDLSELDDVVDALGDLNKSMLSLDQKSQTDIDNGVNKLQEFATTYIDIGDFAKMIDNMDFNDNADETGKTTDDYAQYLLTELNEAVFANESDFDTSGISIWDQNWWYKPYYEEFAEFAEQANIAEMESILV